ncbi:MAG: Gldg family protein [Oscillospiraceae bacterium]|nr:Gldg family protein [Oscillospiraceae bacterium]
MSLFKKKTEILDEANNTEATENVSSSNKKEEKFKKERVSKKTGLTGAELKKRLKYGSLSVVFTAIVIAAVIICNIVIELVAARIPTASIDTTDKQYYELSEQSIDYLKTLEKYEIEIIFIGEKTDLVSDEYYYKVITLAEKYKMYTPHLKISYVDIDKNPGFAADYDNIELALGDALVVCGERYRQLSTSDFIYTQQDESTSGSTSENGNSEVNYSLTAEYALSTAIMVVTASDDPVATVITGHGEQMPEKLTNLLENNGYAVNSQSILKELDYNSNLLVIAAPTKDYSEGDLKKLDEFLYNGGKYGKNVMYIADYTQPVLPNVEAFLHDWGIVVSEGVVYESDESIAYASNPALNHLDFIDAELTLGFAMSEVSAYGYYGRPTTIAKVLDTYMENSIILQHTETSKVGKATENGFDKGDGEAYPYVAMARTTYSRYSQDLDVLESNLLYVNSLGFFEDEQFEKAYSANPDITIAAVDSTLGRGNTLAIPSKSLTAAALGITYNMANTIGIIATVVVPVLLLILCIVVYIRRRFL